MARAVTQGRCQTTTTSDCRWEPSRVKHLKSVLVYLVYKVYHQPVTLLIVSVGCIILQFISLLSVNVIKVIPFEYSISVNLPILIIF